MCVNILHFDPNQYALFNPIMLLRHDLSMLHLLGLIAIKTSVFLSQALSLFLARESGASFLVQCNFYKTNNFPYKDVTMWIF